MTAFSPRLDSMVEPGISQADDLARAAALTSQFDIQESMNMNNYA